MKPAHSGAGTQGRPGQLIACTLAILLSACSSFGASGPTSRAIASASQTSIDEAGIQIIDVTDTVTRRVRSTTSATLFSQAFGDVAPVGTMIGRGDTLEVTIWESPPAALFGNTASFGARDTGATLAAGSASTQRTSLPEMMVDDTGRIAVPFAGSIQASGRTPAQVSRQIVSRLTGKAHDPEVIVRLVNNKNANVTVVGDVVTNARVPLTPHGERLLDVLASAGGPKQAIGKTTIQVSREGRIVSLPLESVIGDPAQNIRLQSNDVVTALYQPFSFTALGATGTSAEVPFEGTGLTLSQALGRIGGLKDDRANVRGVFIFRFEDPAALDPALAATARRTPDGRVPVIYRVDLKNPATLFVAQSFPIRNKDVLYASSAPLSDLQRFVSIVSSVAFTVIGLGQAVP
jgi:polysaccharide export outer membrane protein